MQIRDVAIIGAGPAGLAAAIQFQRYAIHPLIFERDQAGGLLWNANLVENYPGFPGGISGPELIRLFLEQAKDAEVEITAEQVKGLSYQDQLFQVQTNVQVYPARIVVIASGTKPKPFTESIIPADILDKVYYNVYPLIQKRQKRVAIIGSGDAAFDYALNLAHNNEVVILNRGEQVKCLGLLWERVSESGHITYYQQTRVLELYQSRHSEITLDCIQGDKKIRINVDYLLIAIGREPQLDFISSIVLDEINELQKERRLYFIGDVKNGIFRQTAIAVGDGLLAAMKAFQQLRET